MAAIFTLALIQFVVGATVSLAFAAAIYYGAGSAEPGKYPPDLILTCLIAGAVVAAVVWGIGRLASAFMSGISRPSWKVFAGTLGLSWLASLGVLIVAAFGLPLW